MLADMCIWPELSRMNPFTADNSGDSNLGPETDFLYKAFFGRTLAQVFTDWKMSRKHLERSVGCWSYIIS